MDMMDFMLGRASAGEGGGGGGEPDLSSGAVVIIDPNMINEQNQSFVIRWKINDEGSWSSERVVWLNDGDGFTYTGTTMDTNYVDFFDAVSGEVIYDHQTVRQGGTSTLYVGSDKAIKPGMVVIIRPYWESGTAPLTATTDSNIAFYYHNKNQSTPITTGTRGNKVYISPVQPSDGYLTIYNLTEPSGSLGRIILSRTISTADDPVGFTVPDNAIIATRLADTQPS